MSVETTPRLWRTPPKEGNNSVPLSSLHPVHHSPSLEAQPDGVVIGNTQPQGVNP